MTQLAITARDNKNLFSNYYLDNQIKNNPEWKKDEHTTAFSEIKKLYDTEKNFIPTLNEKQLEQRFFAPIFKILNHTFEVNEGTEQGEFPDYAFFPDRASLDDAHKKMGNSFYDNAFAIGEVKRWGIELDRFGKDEKDRKRNPSLQIWIYLHDVSPKWGILSNGTKWRLYCTDRRRDDYYEIDLPSLLATNDIENFKYFYYFFRRDAYLRSTDGKIFLDEVLKGSADYAKDIGDDLKDNVYKAMKKVAEGFFSWSQNGLDIQNMTARETVQKCTMLLLYRFLFLLYAEGKGLLDLKKPQYQSYSFYKLKNEVKEKQDGPLEQRYLGVGTALWAHLKDLFRLINQGSESLGIKDKNVLDVPAYNGGLFDPQKNPELEKWVIGDTFLSEAIDLLSRSRADGGKLDFVDYSTLEIRHLGSIYEGLLEYKLRVAEDEMVVNGGEWVKLEEYNKDRKQKKVFLDFNEFDRVNYGQIYLATDKGERKATGSYYTPDYIVNYIVKNTIGPVVDEKWKEAQANNKSFVDATLSVKVLDPAMGSGHFLVGSIEFLSEKLLLAVKKDIDNGRFSDESHLTSDWARREVVAHCIYGVDLNLMAVELAKVGLWLTTISKEKPLSFLDHRLKQGNSLIGAHLIDLPWYPDLKDKTKKKENTVLQKFEDEVHRPFVDKIVQQLNALSEIDDDTIEHINQKKALFEKLKENKQYLQIKSIADVYTAVYFGNETTEVNKNPKFAYNDLFWALKGDEKEWSRKTYKPWFKTAMEIARDKSFFHWELEFPELFFEGGAPKENPGWDAVVGNPPYGASFDSIEKDYIMKNFETVAWRGESYIAFIELSLNMGCKNGYTSMIVPDTWMSLKFSEDVRTLIFASGSLKQIVALPTNVFEAAAVDTSIYVLEKKIINKNIPKIEFSSETHVTVYPKDASINSIDTKNEIVYDQLAWAKNTYKIINPHGTPYQLQILNKINNFSGQLSKLTEIKYGLKAYQEGKGKPAQTREQVDKKEFTSEVQKSPDFRPFLEGREIFRYLNTWDENNWISWGSWLAEPRSKDLFKGERLLFRKIAGKKLTGTYIDKDAFSNTLLYIIKSKDRNCSLKFILSVLNSALIGFFFRLAYSIQSEDLFPQIMLDDISNLPIRRISFTTTPDRRTALVEQAKALFSEFLGAPDNQKILEFIGARLSAAPEESDVVHDLLAYLAERMIEMNKEKNAEIKGFLRWFEGEIGAPVEELTNKTAIKEYYEAGFDMLAGVLAKNKKKLKDGYDPTRREPKEKLLAEFNASVGKLAPLLKRIEATDELIDQIVYKLYGLTSDEIKIVEGSISGEKNAESSKT